MARCEELEAILQAQFELEYADPQALEERLRRLNLRYCWALQAWRRPFPALALFPPSG